MLNWTLLTGSALGDESDGYAWSVFEIRGDAPNSVDVGLGAYNLLDEGGVADPASDKISALGRVEVRLGRKVLGIGPAVGIMANTDGGVYGYGGLYADVAWRNIIVTPFAGIGGYAQGDSKDLGGVFQFRLALGVGYEFEDRSRLGVQFGHLSNANINDENPGEEDLLLTWQIPF